MVKVTCGSVYIHTKRIRNISLVGVTHEFRIVCGISRSSDKVGMYLEINDAYFLLALTLDYKQGRILVSLTDRPFYIGVLPAGIGSCRAVLHSVSSDKGNVLCHPSGVKHFCGRKVSHSKHCNVDKLMLKGSCNLILEYLVDSMLVCVLYVGNSEDQGTCVGVRCVYHDSVGIHTELFCYFSPYVRREKLAYTDNVNAHNYCLFLSVVKGYRRSKQGVDHTV